MKARSLLAGAVAALSMAGAAQAFTIDAFTDAQFLIDLAAGGSPGSPTNDSGDVGAGAASVGPSANILGGYRVAELNLTENSGLSQAISTLSIGGGELSFSSDAAARAYAIVMWNGTNTMASHSGLGAVNLTQYGSAFLTETRNNDLGFNFSVTVWSNGGTKSSTIFLPSLIQTPYINPGVPDAIPFAAFATCGVFAQCTGGGADFTQVSALQLILNWENVADLTQGTQDLDLRIGPIGTTPEPGALALFGAAALAGAVTMRRRRQSKQA